MSADVSVPATQLSLTVPRGWRPVRLDRVFGESIPDLMIAVLGDELDATDQVALREEFGRVRNEISAEHIAFMALRFADDAARRDVLTVAVHGVGGAAPALPAAESRAPQEAAGDRGERVSIAGREAIVHRSSDQAAADPDHSSGSWVQVVALLSGEEGAVVTIVSSAAGQDEALRADATEVAASLALVSADSERPTG